MVDFCRANCNGECPEGIICPYDETEAHGKNRDNLRKSRHEKDRSRKSARKNVEMLKKKKKKIPESSRNYHPLNDKARKQIHSERKKCR